MEEKNKQWPDLYCFNGFANFYVMVPQRVVFLAQKSTAECSRLFNLHVGMKGQEGFPRPLKLPVSSPATQESKIYVVVM